MVYQKNQKGISLLTLIITIVVIIILALITMRVNNTTLDEALSVKFKQELADVKRGVETVKLINSKEGLDEKTLNQNFKKVEVVNPPDNFVSFDSDKFTAYLVDLEEIDYKKIKTGQEYKNINEGDTVTFEVDDVYVYDQKGTVYYVKGAYLDGEEISHTIDKEKANGPKVVASNTEDGKIEIKVKPTSGGEITTVTVNGNEATKVSEGVYEITVDKNGTYTVLATEEGSGTTLTKVKVTKISEGGLPEVSKAPTKGAIKINGGELYTKESSATLHIDTDAELIYIKHITTGSVPVAPSASSSNWKVKTNESPLYLSEGKNDAWVWFKNKGNSTILYSTTSIILDTEPPTKTKPTIEDTGTGKYKITANQIDIGSGLNKIEIGYKLEDESDYKWETVDIANPSLEITNEHPNKNYIIVSRAEDKVGLSSISEESYTGTLNTALSGITIGVIPSYGWTRRSTAIITYPETATGIEKWYRIDGGTWMATSNSKETLYFEENVVIEAVLVKIVNNTSVLGEIAKATITNIDSTKPEIGEIELSTENTVNGADYTAKTMIKDYESGINAYAVTETELEPTSWHSLEKVSKSYETTFDAYAGKTYYVWVKDDVGNISYKGIQTGKLNINNTSITVELPENSFEYTGEQIKPEVIVKDDGALLKEKEHYTLKYEDNVNVGTGKITITGKGAYEGTRPVEFNITKVNIVVSIENYEGTYDAKSHTITVTFEPSENKEIYYSDKVELTGSNYISEGSTEKPTRKNAGTTEVYYYIKDTSGNYNDYSSSANNNNAKITINKKSIEGLEVALTPSEYTYDGTAKTPAVTVRDGSILLSDTTDYTVAYRKNKNATTETEKAKVIVTGSGNYEGIIEKEFTIEKYDLSNANIAAVPNQTYTGNGITPTPKVTVNVPNETELTTADFEYSYSENINVGTNAKVTITAKSDSVNYKGSKTITFTIVAKTITESMVSISPTEYTYDGTAKTPTVTVTDGTNTLVSGTDYKVSYDNNINATDAAKVIITGNSKYGGTVEKTFTIEKANGYIALNETNGTITYPTETTGSFDITSSHGGTLSVKSSDTSVATVELSGTTVTMSAIANGSTTITVKCTATDNYKEATATYTLTVNYATYTVIFDANGGSVETTSKSVIYNNTYGELPIPTRDDFEFVGWFTSGDTQIKITSTDLVTQNITLYAHWYGAQAIYTEGNQTLTFVKREAIAVGDTFSGETATEVYTGFEEDAYIYASYVPWNDYALNIEKVVVKDTISPVSTAWWFWSMRNAVSIDVAKLNTTNVRDMSWMFHEAGYNTTTFEIIGLNNWNTSNVNTMSRMFNFAGYKVDEFEISGLNNWDTTNVTDMSYMFSHTGYNSQTWKIEDLSNWNTLNVTNMEFMFDYSGYMAKNYELVGINKWDTRSVRNMSYMFNCAGQFANTWTIGKLDNWNTSNVTNFKYMFCLAGDSATTWDIGNLSKKTITKEDGTTYTAWNTYNATDMSYMFQSAGSNATTWTIGDIGNWNVSKVTNMTRMLSGIGYNVNTFTMDLGSWDTSSATSMSEMFYSTGHNAKTFELKGLNNWDTSNVTSMSSMFWNLGYSSNGFSLDLSGWNTSNITDMSYMFHNGERLINLNISGWNTSNVTSSSGMFNNCNRLEEITVGTGFTLASLLPTPSSTYITGADGKWYNKATGAEYTPATIPSGEAATYVAVDPKISIIFDANGGNVTGYNATSVTLKGMPGLTYAEIDYGNGLPGAVWSGYVFSGWYTEVTGGEKILDTTIIAEPVPTTLYAQWTEPGNVNFIYYEDPTNASDCPETVTVPAGTYYEFPVPEDDEFEFMGWFYYADETPGYYVWAGDGVTPETGKTYMFYAAWDYTDLYCPCCHVDMVNGACPQGCSTEIARVSNAAQAFSGTMQMNVCSVHDVTSASATYSLDSSTSTEAYSTCTTPHKAMNTMTLPPPVTEDCESAHTVSRHIVIDNNTSFYRYSCIHTDDSPMITSGLECRRNRTIFTTDDGLGGYATPISFNIIPNGYTYRSISKNTTVTLSPTEYEYDGTAKTPTVTVVDKETGATLVNGTDYEVAYSNNINIGTGIATITGKGIYSGTTSKTFEIMVECACPGCDELTQETTATGVCYDCDTWYTCMMCGICDTHGNICPECNLCKNCGCIHNAYAVYSETDKSLTFYKTTSAITAGSTYNGKAATAVYTGFEDAEYTSSSNVPWKEYSGKITTVTVSGTIRPISTAYWFSGFNVATTINLENLNTSRTKNMSNMFDQAGFFASTFTLTGLGSWDTSRVTNMSNMFSAIGYNAKTVTLTGLDSWNTSNVTNMRYMFSNALYSVTTWKMESLGNWDTSSVTDMSGMFQRAGYKSSTFTLTGLGSWDTSNVTDMTYMFSWTGYGAKTYTLTGIDSWNTSNVTSISHMFENAGYTATTFALPDLGSWNTSNVTSMNSMFESAGYNATTFTLTGLNSWDTSKVTYMSSMFKNAGYNANPFSLNLSSWNTNKVTSYSSMFSGCRKLKEITIGTGFTLAAQLPTPSSTYITGADGLWYNKTTGRGYLASTIPSGTAATYVAVNPGILATNLTIYFRANGGSVSPTSKNATSGNPYGTLPTPTRSGYIFNGWYTSTSGGTKITSTTIISTTGTQYLYAQWTANYCNCSECENLTDNWLCADCSIDANGDGYETTCMGCGVCENHRAVCSECLLCADCGCTHGISGGGSGGDTSECPTCKGSGLCPATYGNGIEVTSTTVLQDPHLLCGVGKYTYSTFECSLCGVTGESYDCDYWIEDEDRWCIDDGSDNHSGAKCGTCNGTGVVSN